MLEEKFHLDKKEDFSTVNTFNYIYESFKCTITIVTMGKIIEILASFPQQETILAVRVNVGECPRLIIKDAIVYPLKVAAHYHIFGTPPPWYLNGLSTEILFKILAFLDVKSILHLGETCRRLNDITQNDYLWSKIFKRDFKTYSGINSKEKYKISYQQRKKSCGTPIPLEIYPWKIYYPRLNFFNDPDSPFFNGEIPDPLIPRIQPSRQLKFDYF